MSNFLVNVSTFLGRRTGAGCEFTFCIGRRCSQKFLIVMVAAGASAGNTARIISMWRRICKLQINKSISNSLYILYSACKTCLFTA